MAFSERLKELRIKRGYSQTQLADELGLTKSAISMYENGKRKPDYEILEAIADLFNVDMNYLLCEEDKSTYILNPDVAEMANELHHNPKLMNLFEATHEKSEEYLTNLTDFIISYGDYNIMLEHVNPSRDEPINRLLHYFSKLSDSNIDLVENLAKSLAKSEEK